MPLLPYTDAPDELLTLFHSEKESVLARYYEPEPGLFIAESAKVAQRAAQAGRGRLRIFRDQTDLAGAELQAALRRELDASRYLIVICSPASAASRWVNEEIRAFCELGRRSRIIPFIVAGEPHSDTPALECYPPALRDLEGDELLGANIQEIGKSKAYLKVASVLLDIRFNRLVDREKRRRLRVVWSAVSAVLAVSLVTGGLLWRNAVITRKNQQLSFDIYGAAIVAIARKDTIEPDELAFLQASAEAGNVDAMLLLADCYENGWGIGADGAAAFRWYRQAAEQGSTQGMVAVANCYLNGIGVQADPRQVFAKGYAAVTDKNGKIVPAAADIIAGEEYDIIMSDGSFSAKVTGVDLN